MAVATAPGRGGGTMAREGGKKVATMGAPVNPSGRNRAVVGRGGEHEEDSEDERWAARSLARNGR